MKEKEVKKLWGREVVIVNRKEYAGKFLYIDKGAESSLHKHPLKCEVFHLIKGRVALHIDGVDYRLSPRHRQETILPGQLHSFKGITNSVILEISTHDDPGDTIRITESRAAPQKGTQ